MIERPTMIKQTRRQLTAWFVFGILFISMLMSILLFWSVDRQLRSDYAQVQQRLEVQRRASPIGLDLGKRVNRSLPMIEYGINDSNLFLEELVEFRLILSIV